jgi:hypothetical protein
MGVPSSFSGLIPLQSDLGCLPEVTFHHAAGAVVGGANSKVMATHSGQGRTCLPSLVEFDPTVFPKTLTEVRGHFEGPLRPRGWGDGHLGDIVELVRECPFDICINIWGCLLQFRDLFLFKVTWGVYRK